MHLRAICQLLAGKPHVIAIFDHVALLLNLANATCKGASKLLAVSVCTKLLFSTMLQLGGIWHCPLFTS